MKKAFYYLPIALFTMSVIGCKEKAKDNNLAENQKYSINNMDTTYAPGSDFFEYANGGWNKANPIPAAYSRYGAFDKLIEQNQVQIKSIIEELGKTKHEEGSIGQKIGTLYTLGMDSVKLNTEGAEPIKNQLETISKATNVDDIIRLTGGLGTYARSPFFSFGVGADEKNSSMNLVQIGQGGLGLGEREYYLAQDTTSVKLRAGYLNLIKAQFINIGSTEADAEKAAKTVLKIETELAKSHFKKEDLRKPELNYNKMQVADLNKKVGNFNWQLFFDAAEARGFEDINVNQLEPIKATIKLIQSTPVNDSKAYLSWCLINTAAPYLSDKFADANFDFYGKQLSGRKEQQPRWKRVVSTVDGALSEAVGQMYVEKYFPAEAKERMLKLVKNLQVSLSERIAGLAWMGDSTKVKAQEKLNNFNVKIGYPDKWIDYTSLDIKNSNYWDNIVRANTFEYNRMLAKINKPVDKSEWFMPPQMVNAYYNPTTNEICFPAGILQPPFFYLNEDDAINYGAIGVVIGHEMSHGFDDQGSQYDKEGNLSNWWTAEDKAKFDARTKVLVEHFSRIEVLPGVFANGEFTLGENIGDFGGLQVSYNAFSKTNEAKKGEKIDGFTPQQRFFLSYSAVWAGNIREQEILRRTKEDPHSLGRWRVNGTLPHIDAWYEAFNITENDALYIPKEKRADIW